MKISILKVVTIAAFAAVSGLANAAAIYNVNLSVGTGSANGTITTDGTVGVLGNANILDWNIILNGNPGNVFTLSGPLSGNNSAVLISGSAFTGTATTLDFDFSAAYGFALFQNPNPGSGINYLCFTAQLCGNFTHAINLGTNVFGVNTSPQTGTQVVARVADSVPEPSIMALLGLAFAGLGLSRLRRTVR